MLSDGALKKQEDFEPDVGPFGYYLEAFFELSTSRINGMGMGPIPFQAIIEYCRVYGIEDYESFRSIIRRMDNKFLKLSAEEDKKTTTKGKGKADGRNRRQ